MPKETSDVQAPAQSSFVLTISSGKISSASLEDGQTSKPLTVVQNKRGVQVDNIPAGDSFVSLAMLWGVGDTDAVVSVTPPARTNRRPRIINVGENPANVTIFGE